MEGGGGGGLRAHPEPRPRITLLDHMSALAADGRDLSGLTLDDILSQQKLAAAAASALNTPPPETAPSPPEMSSRTLLEIIRDEDPKASSCKGFALAASRDRRSWRSFKDRLSLNRSGSGANWTSSVHVPTSDLIIPTSRSMVSRRNSVGSLFADSPPRSDESPPRPLRPQISRRSSCRLGPNTSFASDPTADSDDNVGPDATSNRRPTLRPQVSRRHSTRFSPETDDITAGGDSLPAPSVGPRRLSVVLAEERSLSAREAVAAQEAAENVAEESESDSPPAVASEDSVAPVRMSLMDLLEETDRQMGFVGSRYTMNDEEEEEDYEEEEAVAGPGNAVARNCCVCMVRHKGAAFIPCGHTFCRLCSRELWVSRGNCPLCNGFILEILDIF